jgi:hypothetical protein
LRLDNRRRFAHNSPVHFFSQKEGNMKFEKKTWLLAVAWVLVVGLSGSCGKSEETESKGSGKSSLADLARLAAGGMTLEEEIAMVDEMIESAGAKRKLYQEFPGQRMGAKARILVYSKKNGKPPGGIIYLNKRDRTITSGWHWYFKDMVPDSVVAVELNDDGLWDIRVVAGDRVLSFIQEETFTLSAGERSDWIAMNGVSSPPVEESAALWKAFDGDTVTAWRSSLGAEGKAFLVLTLPFGVADGILTVRTLEDGQPEKCNLIADGKAVQQFDLRAEAAAQMIQLDRGVVGAKEIRLEFTSAHGGAQAVQIAEIELR